MHRTSDEIMAEVLAATEILLELLPQTHVRTATFRELIRRGTPVSEIYQELGGMGLFDEVHKAVTRFTRASLAARIVVIRKMVDEEGLSFSEIARRMGKSRQLVARLYHSGRG